MSQATTPHAFAIASAMPVSLLTSVNVPFPLLWNNQHGIGSYTRGIQYQRSLVSRLPHHLFFPLLKSTNRQTNKWCGNRDTNERWYCIPRVYEPMPCWLFHNNGNGTFTDVSKETGIAEAMAKAWGVVACDINNDGWMDLFEIGRASCRERV